MKDPEKRLSWPDLLHHPFVADGVLSEDYLTVLSSCKIVFSMYTYLQTEIIKKYLIVIIYIIIKIFVLHTFYII